MLNALSPKRVNFEDCLYLCLKNKNKKSLKYIQMMEMRKEVLFVLPALCVNTWTQLRLRALGPSELMFSYMKLGKNDNSYFPIAVQTSGLKWVFSFDSLFDEEKQLGWRDSLFISNKPTFG